MMPLQTIVFDLDGTLIHSAPDLQLAANEALAPLGRGPLDLPTVISFIGDGVETLVLRCLNATGGASEGLHRDTLALFLKIYAQNVTTHTRPYPGVVAALEDFCARGIKLGICTNKPTAPAVTICDALDISKYFDAIVGAEPDQPKKPAPASLLSCIQSLGGGGDGVLYVGDSVVDYETALNASVPFRLFSGGYLNAPLPDLAGSDRFADWAAHGIGVT